MNIFIYNLIKVILPVVQAEEIMMINFLKKSRLMLAGMLYGMLLTMPAVADDIEIYTGSGTADSSTQANVMFILDTSGSMDTNVDTRDPYNPATDYSGGSGCYLSDHVYAMNFGYSFSSTNSSGQTNAEVLCGFSSGSFEYYVDRVKRSKVVCDAAASLDTTGYYTGRVSQYRSGSWRDSIATKDVDKPIECEADSGNHGETTGDARVWAANSAGWSNDSADSINWNTVGTSITLSTGNYLNYMINAPITSTSTRIDIMKDVVGELVNSTSGINISLMRFSSDSDGGMVVVPMGDVDEEDGAGVKVNKVAFADELNRMTADGGTPLSEAYYEGVMYFQGQSVDYGMNSTERVSGSNVSYPSVAGSRTGNTYKSPIVNECQKNYILVLTDGEPTSDTLNSTRRAKIGVTGCGDIE